MRSTRQFIVIISEPAHSRCLFEITTLRTNRNQEDGFSGLATRYFVCDQNNISPHWSYAFNMGGIKR